MLPLTRSQTPQSTHSWWSDRNPLGATISIHAAAKPLMKLMYHEQVRGFIKRSRGTPLSKATMETCVSYLAFKYISPVTKSLILRELYLRVAQLDAQDTRVATDSVVVQETLFEELLGSSVPEIRQYACGLLGILASTYPSLPWCLETCARIVSLLSDENTEVRECAFLAFLKISKSRQGLHAVERTKIWDHFPEHLSSLSSVIHQITWNILTNLAVHAVDSLAVEGSSESDSGTRRRAIQTLSQLSYWPEGAEAAAQAGVLEYFPDLLNSSDVEVRGWTCGFLGNLAFHGSISAVELGIELCTQAISILSDEDSHVRDCAILALSKLHRCPGGMGEVAWHPAILKHFVVHLDSSDARIRRFTCSMLGDLAVFQSAALAMFDFEPCIRLAGMLKDTDDDVQHWAVYALSKLSRWPGAARAIEAEALHHIPALLESSDTDIQTWTCEIVANLAIHTNMPLEEICVRTVSLLRNGGSGVREHALYAIAKFSRSCEGAEMVGGTNIWEFFSELLDSFDPRICQFTCSILGNLAIHDPDSLALLGSPSYVTQAASLLRDEEVEVQRYALYALAKISCCPDAASWVAADALTLESLLVLLSSFDPYTRRWTCETLAHLALHGCITPIELGSKACAQIAVLLSDENKHVRRGAILALSKISRSRDGAEVVGATKILKYATKLLDSNHTRVLACETLGNLACYQALPQLGRVLRKQLTALLSDEDVDIRESAMFALSYGTRETVQ